MMSRKETLVKKYGVTKTKEELFKKLAKANTQDIFLMHSEEITMLREALIPQPITDKALEKEK